MTHVAVKVNLPYSSLSRQCRHNKTWCTKCLARACLQYLTKPDYSIVETLVTSIQSILRNCFRKRLRVNELRILCTLQLKERNGSRLVLPCLLDAQPSPPMCRRTRADHVRLTAVKLSKSTSRPTTRSATSPTPPSRAMSTVPSKRVKRLARSYAPRVSARLLRSWSCRC